MILIVLTETSAVFAGKASCYEGDQIIPHVFLLDTAKMDEITVMAVAMHGIQARPFAASQNGKTSV